MKYKIQPIILLTHTRSGSSALASFLDSHPEIVFYQEVFARNNRYDGFGVAGIPFKTFIDQLFNMNYYAPFKKVNEWSNSNNLKFIDIGQKKRCKYVGVKITIFTLISRPRLLLWVIYARPHILFLYRSIFGAANSMVTVYRTGVYHKHDDSKKAISYSKFSYYMKALIHQSTQYTLLLSLNIIFKLLRFKYDIITYSPSFLSSGSLSLFSGRIVCSDCKSTFVK